MALTTPGPGQINASGQMKKPAYNNNSVSDLRDGTPVHTPPTKDRGGRDPEGEATRNCETGLLFRSVQKTC